MDPRAPRGIFAKIGKKTTVLSVTKNSRDDDPLRRLAEQVQTYSRQAEEVGRMVTGHPLLACPACGLAEDALADLTVRVVHPDHPEVDTGLRFEAADESETVWTCPGCGELFERPASLDDSTRE